MMGFIRRFIAECRKIARLSDMASPKHGPIVFEDTATKASMERFEKSWKEYKKARAEKRRAR